MVAPGLHQTRKSRRVTQAQPDPLVSQFRATYSTLLNLLDAYGNFAQVREIAEKSFAHRDAAHQMAQLDHERAENEARIKSKLGQAGCQVPLSTALGLERLVSARTRLQELKPQTRAEVLLRWLMRQCILAGLSAWPKRKSLVLVTNVAMATPRYSRRRPQRNFSTATDWQGVRASYAVRTRRLKMLLKRSALAARSWYSQPRLRDVQEKNPAPR